MLVTKDSLLNILLPNDNKALKEVLKEADSKTLETSVKEKNQTASDILKNLFSDLKSGNKTSFTIENMLKNSNLEKQLGSFSKNLDVLLNLLKADPTLSKHTNSLENLFKDIKNLNANVLETQLNNSGIHLESKLLKLNDANANNPKLDLNNDMKALLLKVQVELQGKSEQNTQELLKQVDKMLTQIDFNQLNSLASNSNYVYVPFFWEMLEEGSIEIKKSDDEKFYCQINLNLKNLGQVDLMLAIYDTNKIDITMKAQKEEFKTLVQENLQSLKKALNSVDFIPTNIKILDLQVEENQNDKANNFKNSYSQDFGSHIDIRV